MLAEALAEGLLARYGIEDYRVRPARAGRALDQRLLKHPFYDREVMVIIGEHVTIEAGTGAVHTAPGHGQDDFDTGSKYGLEVYNPVGDNGCFLPDTELFAGEHVFKANDHINEVLKEHGALLHVEKFDHSYPHCWRHKTPIIFRATPQWFISMDQAGPARGRDGRNQEGAVDSRLGPGAHREHDRVRPDWCISRQRYLGRADHAVHAQTNPGTASAIPPR